MKGTRDDEAPGQGERAGTEAGLTLIELGIVLLLMAILAGFAVPRLFMLTELNLRTSARKLAESVRLIPVLATNYGRPYTVRYEMDKHRYCYVQERRNPATGEDEAFFPDESTEILEPNPALKTRCFQLEDGVRFKDIEVLDGSEERQEKGTVFQRFLPRAITDPLALRLTDKKGRVYTLFVYRYGGRVDVREGDWTYKELLEELLQ